MIELNQLLNLSNVKLNLKGKCREDIFKQLIEFLPIKNLNEKLKKRIFDNLMKREQIQATSIGKGVAIPHTQIDMEEKIALALGISENPIICGLEDNIPVRIFCIIVADKNQTPLLLKVIARSARILNHENLINKLLEAKTSQEIIDLIKLEEHKVLK